MVPPMSTYFALPNTLPGMPCKTSGHRGRRLGLTCVQRLERGKHIRIFLNQIRKPPKRPPTVSTGGLQPPLRFERL